VDQIKNPVTDLQTNIRIRDDKSTINKNNIYISFISRRGSEKNMPLRKFDKCWTKEEKEKLCAVTY